MPKMQEQGIQANEEEIAVPVNRNLK